MVFKFLEWTWLTAKYYLPTKTEKSCAVTRWPWCAQIDLEARCRGNEMFLPKYFLSIFKIQVFVTVLFIPIVRARAPQHHLPFPKVFPFFLGRWNPNWTHGKQTQRRGFTLSIKAAERHRSCCPGARGCRTPTGSEYWLEVVTLRGV